MSSESAERALDPAALSAGATTPWRRAAIAPSIAAVSIGALVWAIVATRPATELSVGYPGGTLVYATPFARLVCNAAGIGAVGAVLLIVLLGRTGRERFPDLAARARTAAGFVGLLWVAVTTTTWWLQAAALSEAESAMPIGGMVSYLRRISSGSALLLTACAAATYAFFAIVRPVRAWPQCGLAVAAVGLVAVPASGHASQMPAAGLTVPAILLHVCAMSAWVGGLALIAILVSTHRPALAVVLPNFSRVAGGSVLTVAVTGAVLAVPRLTQQATPDLSTLASALVTTPAGWLVIGKLAGLAVVTCTGGYIRQRLLPAVRREQPVAIAGIFVVELAAMATTVALATVLARPV